MSLAIALANPYGIVMSADRRVTGTTFNESTNTVDTFVITDHEQKIFLTPSGHGIACVGEGQLSDGCYLPLYVNQLVSGFTQELSLQEELEIIKSGIRAVNETAHTTLIGAAIQNGKNIILFTKVSDAELTNCVDEKECGMACIGEVDPASKIASIYVDAWRQFSLQDSIEYVRFLTRTVADLMKYSLIAQTVSEECDILIITDAGARWITSPLTLN